MSKQVILGWWDYTHNRWLTKEEGCSVDHDNCTMQANQPKEGNL